MAMEGDSGLIQPHENFTEESVKNYLNEVYGKQTNTYFEVTWIDKNPANQLPLYPNFQKNNGTIPGFVGSLMTLDLVNGSDEGDLGPGPEADVIIKDKNHFDEDAAINIYLMGCEIAHQTISKGKLAGGGWQIVNGVGMPANRLVFVDGRLEPAGLSPERQAELFEGRLRTIAHEVGHVLLGPGHPGNAPNFIRGVVGLSPLPGTDHKKRLMFAGQASVLVSPEEKGTQLVKMEWDEIEEWSNRMIADPSKRGVQ